MKKLLAVIPVLFLLSFTVVSKGTRYQDDKKFLLDYYQQTKDNLLKSVAGLTPAQLEFKAAPDRWSIGQCLEHIVSSEKGIFGWEQQLMQQPANPEKRSEIKTKDEDLIKGVNDRSNKKQAPEQLQPQKGFTSVEEAVKAFEKEHSVITDYIASTNDKLRDHITQSPQAGYLDAYQVLLLLAAHTSRHTAQINEVKAAAGFPK